MNLLLVFLISLKYILRCWCFDPFVEALVAQNAWHFDSWFFGSQLAAEDNVRKRGGLLVGWKSQTEECKLGKAGRRVSLDSFHGSKTCCSKKCLGFPAILGYYEARVGSWETVSRSMLVIFFDVFLT